jgi:hypothetical protein
MWACTCRERPTSMMWQCFLSNAPCCSCEWGQETWWVIPIFEKKVESFWYSPQDTMSCHNYSWHCSLTSLEAWIHDQSASSIYQHYDQPFHISGTWAYQTMHHFHGIASAKATTGYTTTVSASPSSELATSSSGSVCTHSLLEKWFIRTPGYQYWCRLVTVADTNNGWLTSRYQ